MLILSETELSKSDVMHGIQFDLPNLNHCTRGKPLQNTLGYSAPQTPLQMLLKLLYDCSSSLSTRSTVLDAHTAKRTSAPFTPTHLYKMAEYLVGYYDEMQKAKYPNTRTWQS
ncbi:hypothetical protein BG000_000281 [Podila horticola]|nr:hypothetical protein BG000_000281 [Podila horticola]